jgi:tRNA nucleotidyltransferase (CCA-adding enzyme)
MEQDTKNLIKKIPKEVSCVTDKLEKAGFEAYLVGGCVRDLLMSQILSGTEGNRKPNDWDVTTNAKPEQIIGLFEKTIYENTFGTVGVCISAKANVPCVTKEGSVSQETSNYNIIEVTPYRIEAKYNDFRHPDEIKFSDKLEDDLKRRDFTINAMALRNSKKSSTLTDMFGGLKDIKDKTIKAVGQPDDRFQEDALRMLRAIRFACQLDFSVSYETMESILKNSDLIKKISGERIRDEFEKIIMSKNPASGILMLQKFNLLKNIIPELEEGINCEQGGVHIYDVWNHLLHAVQHAANKNWPLEIRLAALFHDIGKPKSRRLAEPEKNFADGRFQPKAGVMSKNSSRVSDEQTQKNSSALLHPAGGTFRVRNSSVSALSKKKYTFYGHEVIGARMTKKIMERLKFPKKEIELVEKLVRNHMFFSDTELITLSAVRRIITKVGKENIWLLMNVRECDRVGMKKKEASYRLRKYFAMIEEALRDPISVGQLKINGEFMIKKLGIAPGPRMGWILNALLEEVLDAPEKNTVEHLSELVKSLNMLGNDELKTLGERGKEKKEELEEEEVLKLHQKHGVQ